MYQSMDSATLNPPPTHRDAVDFEMCLANVTTACAILAAHTDELHELLER